MRELASEVGFEVDEEGASVIDHLNYDVNDLGKVCTKSDFLLSIWQSFSPPSQSYKMDIKCLYFVQFPLPACQWFEGTHTTCSSNLYFLHITSTMGMCDCVKISFLGYCMFSCWLVVLPMYINCREFEAYRVLVGKHLLNILIGRCAHIWQSIVKMDHKEWKWSVCLC